MKTRIITAVVAIAGIFPFFWFSDPVGLDNPLHYVFPILISAISFVSAFELLRCLSLHRNLWLSLPMLAVAAVFPMLARVMVDYRTEFLRAALLTALVFALYAFGVIVFSYGKVDNVETVALAFMTVFYTTAGYTAIIILRDEGAAGRFLFLIPFVFSWVTDTFAYFTGRLFGKHKLIPNVSPKKTVEGAVGGVAFCALTAVLYGFVVAKIDPAVAPNYLALSLGGILLSFVSQLGDFLMSVIKRHRGVKDYGKFLPGHGGLLDRFDSSLAVTAVLMVINAYVPLFVL